MKKNKLIISSDVEIKVDEEIQSTLSQELKKIVDEISAKYKRNLTVKVSVKID